ncbi:disulfide bond formation protein DsbD [Paenibacillus lemnae]|uniref:Disulfide bond formation protein DsbD n=1 Tax=Paenibacillus lemnae TaxID=1330551 RepID=A0A848M1V3_PAELE|nr:disulfide bond formation protein DsbD [Paenibacillus lemnae]NMO94231.1 disulfide bond formation protein DsbD [Paenibacillus lemnae]
MSELIRDNHHGCRDVPRFGFGSTWECLVMNESRSEWLQRVKWSSSLRVPASVLAFILSVGTVVGLIYLAKTLIQDVLHLTGWVQTVTQVIAIIVALYPVKFVFRRVVRKLTTDDHVKPESGT